jgi:ferredoxin
MRFTVARPVLDADVLINVPKVKTHMLTTLTAAVKNLYGVIPGFQKTSLHKLYPRPDQFGALLAAVAERVPAALTVADAIVGMEGNGPSAGTPVRLGFLAAAADPAALDAVLCRVLRIPPRRVHYLGALARRRHGRGDWADVETVGAAPAAVAPRAFRLPRVPPLGLVPMGLVRLVQPLVWTRPRFTERCTACGQCVRQCPTEALRQEAGEWPVLDPGRCIECCCCHEICPARAVVMEPSPLLRLVRGGKRP